MKRRDAERMAVERLRLLEQEAGLQRSELLDTFGKWEKRKALAWGSTLATWGFRLFARPQVRWLLASTILARWRGRRTS